MEIVEADQKMQFLEQRYHGLMRVTQAVRNELLAAQEPADESDRGLQATLQSCLERVESEMHSIMRKIDSVEDSLLE